MSFNLDKSKQAQEVIFSYKSRRINYYPVIFNNIPVVRTSCQKHFGLCLDKKLNVNHIKEKNSKANKSVGIIRNIFSKCFFREIH